MLQDLHFLSHSQSKRKTKWIPNRSENVESQSWIISPDIWTTSETGKRTISSKKDVLLFANTMYIYKLNMQ